MSSIEPADPTNLWSERHAWLMLIAVGGALAGTPLAFSAALSIASLFGLLVRGNKRWTPNGRFGLANAITLLRWIAATSLLFWPTLEDGLPTLVATAVIAADGLDGWFARRRGESSHFGQLFDMEADAWLLLVLCLLIFRGGLIDAWILLPGCLRYAYVLTRLRYPGSDRPSRALPATRAIGLLAMLGLAACLLPEFVWRQTLAATVVGLLCGSFGFSFWQLRYRSKPAPP